jgi:hypothetical protein
MTLNDHYNQLTREPRKAQKIERKSGKIKDNRARKLLRLGKSEKIQKN